MAATRGPRWPARMFNYANNPLTIAGIVGATVSAVLIIVYIISDVAGAIENPYLGIVAYMILPAVFVLSLVLIPIGMWRRRRTLQRAGATDEEVARYPRLDFNDPAMRRTWTLVLGLTVINAVILGGASYLAVHEMDTVEFCGTVCHTVMQPEYNAYQESPHSRVKCVQCHIGPGAPWFVRAKIDGLRQVWQTALNTYNRPIPSPVHTLRPARATCEACHWPAKHYGDKLRVFARFADDEANSPSYSVMVLKTGGGDLDSGRHGGIHWWHIYADNKIRYITSDERRQEMTWVELTTADGTVFSYTKDGAEAPAAETIESTARLMDCIDCHNRPTHLFMDPSDALDEVLERQPGLRALKFYKRDALAAVTAEYATHEEGVAAVRETILQAYRGAGAQEALVLRAAEEAARVYDRTVFPEMRTDWRTHPNNIGHERFPGCYRCHDGSMATADGERMIPADCETCHTFVVEDSPTLPEVGAAFGSQPVESAQ